MKKLRDATLFEGHAYPYLIAAICGFGTVFLTPLLMQAELTPMPALLTVLAAGTAAFCAVLMLFRLWFSRLTDEERTRIAEAAPPVWRPLKPLQRSRLKSQQNGKGTGCILAVLLLPSAFLASADSLFSRKGPTPAAIVLPVIAVITVLAGTVISRRNTRFWMQAADGDAEAAVIPVARSFSRKVRTRTYHYYNYYAVIYLPDGRYTLKTEVQEQTHITLIRYRNRFCVLS